MIRIVLLATVMIALGARAGHAAPPAWCAVDDPARARTAAAAPCPAPDDPQTLPDRLALPLPCFGYLLMSKVVVSASTVLDDQKVYLGSPPPDPGGPALAGLVEGPHVTRLAGGFNHGEGPRKPEQPAELQRLNGRSYYLAVYPLTEPQLRRIRLIGDANAAPSDAAPSDAAPSNAACQAEASALPAGRAPVRAATGLSWFDANDVLRRYQSWLLAHDRAAIAAHRPPALPWEQGSPAYLRLPTEAEWEFAARGGAAGEQDQGRQFYAMVDPATGEKREATLEDVAALRAAGGSEERGAPPLGRTLPNTLGLQDLLGNVEQMTLEPFRLTRPDELQGQAGGYVVKGGNALTSPRALRVGHRREVPYFDLDGETRSDWVGVRFALSVPVFVGGVSPNPTERFAADRPNQRLVDALTAARAHLVISADADRSRASENLDALRSQTRSADQQDLRARLDGIKAELDSSNARLTAEAEVARQAELEGAVLLAANLRALRHSTDTNRLLADIVASEARGCLRPNDLARELQKLNAVRDRINELEAAVEPTFDYYLSRLQDLARLPAEQRAAAASAVQRSFQGRSLSQYDRFQQVVVQQAETLSFSNNGIPARLRQSWSKEIYDALRNAPTRERNQ